MVNKNIAYKSKQILEFYRAERDSWESFYPSEKFIFEKVYAFRGTFGDVLDVGCACGGLGAALGSRFKMDSYTGVDINKDAIEWASKERKMPVKALFVAEDIVSSTRDRQYDTVASLGCADWNIETRKIIESCWKRVKPRGYFIVSLRLTPERGINNIAKSYQLIDFSGNEEKPEIANYVVLNVNDAVSFIKGLSPSPEAIGAYGYWGKPSSTARTPFDRIIFSVFYVKKGMKDHGSKAAKLELELPIS